ncbi:MAG: hypothetical protein U1F35_14745 [Steroidobacteraceae bacterium]
MFALLASCTGGIQVTPSGSGEGAMAEPLGGADGRSQGLRNAPSLRYVLYTPSFHFESDGTPVQALRPGRSRRLAARPGARAVPRGLRGRGQCRCASGIAAAGRGRLRG